MRDRCVILRSVVLVAAAVVMTIVVAGCSSVEPTDAWSTETSKVTGTVRSDSGTPLSGIEVWLWAELGTEEREVWYETVTDQYGDWEIDGVEMATPHSYEATYWVGANRTAERTSPINTNYESWTGTLDIPRGDTVESHVVLVWVDGDPEDPETYVED
jgi:hypothetical protein